MISVLGLPRAVSASWKYSNVGLFDKESFTNHGLDSSVAKLLADLANLGLAKSTHKVYQTAANHVRNCELENNINLELPFNTQKLLIYLNYLMHDKNLSAKTCDKYLSGIRMMHLRNGYDVPVLRPAIISLLLKGRENFEDIQNKLNKKEKRTSVTLMEIKLLKRRIRKIT